MASCVSCGRETGGSSLCTNCGASQSSGGATTVSPTAGLNENIAGLLCYLFAWVSGLVFLVVDKRPFVRFHGAQSIALFLSGIAGAILFGIVWVILTIVTMIIGFPIGILFGILFPVFGLTMVGTYIFCMFKAYRHERFKLPVIGGLVEKWVG